MMRKHSHFSSSMGRRMRPGGPYTHATWAKAGLPAATARGTSSRASGCGTKTSKNSDSTSRESNWRAVNSRPTFTSERYSTRHTSADIHGHTPTAPNTDARRPIRQARAGHAGPRKMKNTVGNRLMRCHRDRGANVGDASSCCMRRSLGSTPAGPISPSACTQNDQNATALTTKRLRASSHAAMAYWNDHANVVRQWAKASA
mmetsp:Transcript_46308/g.116616  ORF Transcript_46308/g.116616 Transcript_46308/m.116616 type:complete len:202 (+) Transcript_46308:1085-1690(+)